MAIDIRMYAQRGAQARLEEIRSELASLYRVFPGLRGGAGRVAASPAAVSKKRQRPPMTAAQKKVVSVRMKKYWAARRSAKAKVSSR